MELHEEPSTWQELLGKLIANAHERQQLAMAARVQPVTLLRWVKGTSTPQAQHMRSLLKALPTEIAPRFLALALKDFPWLNAGPLQGSARNPPQPDFEHIPSAFYAQILEASTQLLPPLRYQTIQELLFQQAIAHLDPVRNGLSINLATCVRPLDGKMVRSLREIGGIGTPPWKRHPENKTILLGAESLAGYALTQFRTVVVPNRTAPSLIPVHWTEYEQSAVAAPIAHQGRLCGCFLVSSAVADTFQEGQGLVKLIERYAHLASFLFEPHECYAPEAIHLGFMPPYAEQLPYFLHVDRLLVRQLRLAQLRGEYCTLEQAQHQVWREIEEALLNGTLRTDHDRQTRPGETEQQAYGR